MKCFVCGNDADEEYSLDFVLRGDSVRDECPHRNFFPEGWFDYQLCWECYDKILEHEIELKIHVNVIDGKEKR